MEDSNIEKDERDGNSKKSLEKGFLAYEDDSKQTLFKFFGIELTAPKGLKNPRIVYVSFILINILLLLILKNYMGIYQKI